MVSVKYLLPGILFMFLLSALLVFIVRVCRRQVNLVFGFSLYLRYKGNKTA
jgi:hypothetical protein